MWSFLLILKIIITFIQNMGFKLRNMYMFHFA